MILPSWFITTMASGAASKSPLNFSSGPLTLGDVVNRSNQMGTSAFVVKDRRDADFAGQPPGRVIRCFFPTHDGIFFDRLSVLSQNHRQGRLWDDLVHRFADHRFQAQSGDPQKSRVDRNEAELPFGFDSQMENDISDGVVDRDKTLFAFAQRLLHLFTARDVDS